MAAKLNCFTVLNFINCKINQIYRTFLVILELCFVCGQYFI